MKGSKQRNGRSVAKNTDIPDYRFQNFPDGGKDRKKRKGTSIDDSTPNRKLHTHLHGQECGKTQNQTRARSISLVDHAGESDASSRRPLSTHLVALDLSYVPFCFGPIEQVLLNKQIHARAADLKRKVGKKELKSRISALHTPSTPPHTLRTQVVDSYAPDRRD